MIAAICPLLLATSIAGGDDLWEAARVGDVARVRALLDAGVPPDSPNPQGATPLSVAASQGSLEDLKNRSRALTWAPRKPSRRVTRTSLASS